MNMNIQYKCQLIVLELWKTNRPVQLIALTLCLILRMDHFENLTENEKTPFQKYSRIFHQMLIVSTLLSRNHFNRNNAQMIVKHQENSTPLGQDEGFRVECTVRLQNRHLIFTCCDAKAAKYPNTTWQVSCLTYMELLGTSLCI